MTYEEMEANEPLEEMEAEELEEIAPNEPDQSPDVAEVLPSVEEEEVEEAAAVVEESPSDPKGIVTALSGELYEQMLALWRSKGSPREFPFRGVQFAVFTEGDGMKFVSVSGGASPDRYYGSLSVG